MISQQLCFPGLPKIFIDWNPAFVSGGSAEDEANDGGQDGPHHEAEDALLVAPIGQNNLAALVAQKYLNNRRQRS